MLSRLPFAALALVALLAGPAWAEDAHEVLLGHPWVVVEVDGAPVELPGNAITFAVGEDEQDEGCANVAEPGGAQDACTWLIASGPLACGSTEYRLAVEGLRIYPSGGSTSTDDRCRYRDTVNAAGDALFAARSYFRDKAGLLIIADGAGSIRLTLRPEASEYVPEVVESDLVLPTVETTEPILAGTALTESELYAKRPSLLEAGVELEGCIKLISYAPDTPDSDTHVIETIGFANPEDWRLGTVYIDIVGSPAELDVNDCVAVRLTSDMAFDGTTGYYMGEGSGEFIRLVPGDGE